MEESKSLKAFKQLLVNRIPCVPNTKESKDCLLEQTLVLVLFHYLHWASRLIPPRPRTVIFNVALTVQPLWVKHSNDIQKIINKAEIGEDLNDHLSNEVLSRGFSPNAEILRQDDRWLCKDRLLNTKGFHHLHLKSGKSNKGNFLLLVKITRNEFHIIGVFTHGIFEGDTPEQNRMHGTLELWSEIHKDLYTTMSGHPIHIHQIASEYWNAILQCDSQLQSREFVEQMFFDQRDKLKSKFKLRWEIDWLDLGVYESKSKGFTIIRKGHI
ncbi:MULTISPECIES: hypothetical protein [unclassified Vibrio]|uniref:hypothetical protein n=1 Tax=unclassified Vibrio TaxID=2614977 RepID=UPI003550AF1B